MHTNEPGKDDFSIRLSALVEKIKDNEKFRMEYADMNLHDWDLTRAAKREGREEGALENAIANARNLIKMNLGSAEQISQAIGLPLEQVLELQKQISTAQA